MIRDFLRHAPQDSVAFGEAGSRTAVDLLADSARIARALAGREPGEVLLIAEDRYHFAAALFGIWRGGHAAALPPNGQPEIIRTLAREPGVRAFLHDRAGSPEGMDVRQLLSGEQLPGGLAAVAADRHLVTLYTSGTTGPSQRCAKTAAQILGEASVLAAEFAVPAGARVLATVPAHHIFGLLFGVLLPLRVGGAFARESPLHPEAVATALERWEATHLASAPAHLCALQAATAAPRLARVFCSGAPLPRPAAQDLASRFGWRVTEVYGSSETGGIAWRDVPDREWRPFPGVAVRAGEGGLLLLDSPLLASDAPRPFHGADRIEMLPDGRFMLLGRVDGVVKVGGKRIALAEVEARVLALPGVRDAVALAEEVEGARGQEILLATVAPGWSAEGLRRALAGWLDPVTLPRRIRIVDSLPREATGKLSRYRVQALFEGEPPPSPVFDLEPDEEWGVREPGGPETRTLSLTIPPALAYFRGHFDGNPVLPGVVQLEGLVLRQVRLAWPELRSPRKVLRLKFKRLIRPAARLTLRLVRRPGEARVDFQLDGAEGGCASGSLLYPSV